MVVVEFDKYVFQNEIKLPMRPKLSTLVETQVSRPVLPFPIIDCPFKGPMLALDEQVCS